MELLCPSKEMYNLIQMHPDYALMKLCRWNFAAGLVIAGAPEKNTAQIQKSF